jgi:GTPase SAR1 family protein
MGQAPSRDNTILPRVPRDIKFRVLIIGRANAGKTSILQRVCDTTESPEVYRYDAEGNRELVRSGS